VQRNVRSSIIAASLQSPPATASPPARKVNAVTAATTQRSIQKALASKSAAAPPNPARLDFAQIQGSTRNLASSVGSTPRRHRVQILTTPLIFVCSLLQSSALGA
jgi:hypothetical protein